MQYEHLLVTCLPELTDAIDPFAPFQVNKLHLASIGKQINLTDQFPKVYIDILVGYIGYPNGKSKQCWPNKARIRDKHLVEG